MCEKGDGRGQDRIEKYLIIDQAPLLQESMHSHDGADIACQIPPACSDGKILDRVQPIGVDHEIAIVFVDCGGLASVASVEELWQRFLLQGMDGVHVEPCTVAGKNDLVCLGNQM